MRCVEGLPSHTCSPTTPRQLTQPSALSWRMLVAAITTLHKACWLKHPACSQGVTGCTLHVVSAARQLLRAPCTWHAILVPAYGNHLTRARLLPCRCLAAAAGRRTRPVGGGRAAHRCPALRARQPCGLVPFGPGTARTGARRRRREAPVHSHGAGLSSPRDELQQAAAAGVGGWGRREMQLACLQSHWLRAAASDWGMEDVTELAQELCTGGHRHVSCSARCVPVVLRQRADVENDVTNNSTLLLQV